MPMKALNKSKLLPARVGSAMQTTIALGVLFVLFYSQHHMELCFAISSKVFSKNQHPHKRSAQQTLRGLDVTARSTRGSTPRPAQS